MITNNELTSLKNINEGQSVKSEILYSSRKFNFFNRNKCDYVYTHFDSKMSMFFGVKDNVLIAPFSAPFALPRYVTDFVKYSHVYDFFEALKNDIEESNIEKVKLTIPPGFYNENIISKMSHSLNSLGFELLYKDLNSHISLKNEPFENLPSKCRNKIRASEKHNNSIVHAVTLEEKERAYNIIKENRVLKGYPLRLSWEQVKDTITNVAKAEFFISVTNDVDSAAAMIFEVSDNVAQVIYWGANQSGEKSHSMYYLPFKVIEYYKSRGFDYLDIGPSSEEGVINAGLNEYKQMIGCINTLKETWVYNK
ncbi:hypothetical protein Spea_1402 [Shewanella pealeana ATCC 700345]|uniref:BioF2-like acetyltransferase domain-containing protein n=1 Tax=Shewanella pealeana (strain ATCC 700345 / ANG-SQ1) TaxID=398579 RepID=A8H2E1_SHEPA|nr:hypothetical protein [Shewanella pealeana]ABV86728.1 hypothetical protein Spea_1402 [Shewanella pealeana ATCC 700345]